MYNCVQTGIYATNAPEACLYQADHSEAEVIVVQNNEYLKRFAVNLSKLTRVKAIVVWDEQKLPDDIHDKRFFLWKDFMKLGTDIPDDVVIDKMQR